MRQGWKLVPLCVLLAGSATLSSLVCLDARDALAAPKAASNATGSAKSRAGLRQFSGFVTAVDKNSLTVEKRGKAPRTVVFEKHAEMKSTGDVEKDARVTVYYSEADGHSVAHRVVVKQSGGGTRSR